VEAGLPALLLDQEDSYFHTLVQELPEEEYLHLRNLASLKLQRMMTAVEV
jgi:anthranilate/para-aminobenzoate synthase component II